MPNQNWSHLSHLQLGQYGEYYAKMEFASYGFDVYTSEVDDHGVDFVARSPYDGVYYEVQVKSARNFSYVYAQKSKMPLAPNRLFCYLRFSDGALPEVYLIPATVWLEPDEVFVSRDYEGEQQTSKPEWGINVSKKNLPRLAPYLAERYFHRAAGLGDAKLRKKAEETLCQS